MGFQTYIDHNTCQYLTYLGHVGNLENVQWNSLIAHCFGQMSKDGQ